MGLFGKKQDRDAIIKQGLADAEAAAAADNQSGEKEVSTGNEKVDIELTKIYAQLESFAEIRKANAERFSRMSEQLGEVRGMIVDTNKAMSKIEVAATKAVDLVESVHPEKLMIEVRKEDGKVEALRANIESNEAIMKDLMNEVKKMREQMNFYKGVEQVAQLNEEVKQELADIKKMEAVIERHADKVETIFLEVEKKFSDFDKFDSLVKELQQSMKKLGSDFDKMKVKVDTKEDKKEFVTLVDMFNNFEQHTTNLLKLLDERSKTVKQELERDFKKLKRKLERKLKTGEVDLESPEPGEKQVPLGEDAAEKASESGVADADTAGADVAGGDVKSRNIFDKIFKKKIVDKSLEGGEGGGEKPDGEKPDGEDAAEEKAVEGKPEAGSEDSSQAAPK